MAHYAKVIDGIVMNVIVADQDFIDAGHAGDPSLWIKTSYNTRGNIHYQPDDTGELSHQIPDNKEALRANYASIGGHYDIVNDVFYSQQPFDSWILNNSTWLWEAPIPMPQDENLYAWNESTISWDKIEIPQ
jgi:hypothetical protein